MLKTKTFLILTLFFPGLLLGFQTDSTKSNQKEAKNIKLIVEDIVTRNPINDYQLYIIADRDTIETQNASQEVLNVQVFQHEEVKLIIDSKGYTKYRVYLDLRRIDPGDDSKCSDESIIEIYLIPKETNWNERRIARKESRKLPSFPCCTMGCGGFQKTRKPLGMVTIMRLNYGESSQYYYSKIEKLNTEN